MARTAADLLRITRSQIGYQEGRNNDNKFGRAYGMNHNAWCQQFVWWVLHQAGVGGEMPKTAVTRVAYPWYRRHRALVPARNAKPGDVVWFDFSSSLKPVSHVGIVEKNLGRGRLQTIEGNTNKAGSRTGGGVLLGAGDPPSVAACTSSRCAAATLPRQNASRCRTAASTANRDR